MEVVSWVKLMEREGDELTVLITPSHEGLLLLFMSYACQFPERIFEDYEGNEEAITDYLEDLMGRLSNGV